MGGVEKVAGPLLADEHRHSYRLGKPLRENLMQLWGNMCLADICISLKVSHPGGTCTTRTYTLHKAVLCTSGYFRLSLKGDWEDAGTGVIAPDDPLIDHDAFEAVLRSLYGYEVLVSKETVLNLLATAAYLQVPEVVEHCKEYLSDILTTAPYSYVARCCSVLWGREYPGRDVLVQKCVDALACASSDMSKAELLEWPSEFLEEFLASDNMWTPDEVTRLNLVVGLRTEVPKSNCDEAKKRKMIDALDRVLLGGIHYVRISEDKMYSVQTKLESVWDSMRASECLKSHLWHSKAFQFAVNALQPRAKLEDQKLLDGMSMKDFGWLRMGGEWTNIDMMTTREARNLMKVYYGGSIWWLQLAYELPGKDKDKDIDEYYGVFLMHEVPRVGDVGGVLVDRREEIKAEIKVVCASRAGLLTRHAIWHVKKNRGWGWPKFLHRSKAHKFMSCEGSLRISLAFRLIID
ncbi:hypothetical protein BSKO_01086 [Bryopsis sp. KO-2023]|nr:hypothetical protein BSKO_01086 [Bryopsis sp. KO-2023]